MTIRIEKRKGFQILGLASQDISESETGRIIDCVRSALSEGVSCQAVSIEAPLSSTVMIMGLLVICEKMVRHFNGHLGLILNPVFSESGLRNLCDSLNVTVYDDEDEFMASPLAVAARHRQEALVSRTVRPDIISQPVCQQCL
jgi:hypothetical protein